LTDPNGRIILKWILKKHNVKMWTGFNWLRGTSKRGNELQGSVRGGKFLDQVRKYSMELGENVFREQPLTT